MRCSACGRNARKLVRAVVLFAGERKQPGRVCPACARGGMLVVAGIEEVRALRVQHIRRRRLARASKILSGQVDALVDRSSRCSKHGPFTGALLCPECPR